MSDTLGMRLRLQQAGFNPVRVSFHTARQHYMVELPITDKTDKVAEWIRDNGLILTGLTHLRGSYQITFKDSEEAV